MPERDELSHGPLSGVRALVLGAGFGTRLRPLTEHVPKPVVPMLGRPLIGHPLIHLYGAGCWNAWVNAHYHPDRLAARLDPWVQRRLQRMRIEYSVEQPEILGTGGACKKLEAELTQGGAPFLMLNGDAILTMDLPGLWATHQTGGGVATLLCIPRPDAAKYGAVVSVNAEGRILDFGGLGRLPGVTDAEVAACTPTVFCGVHVIEPSVLAVLPDGAFSGIVRQGYVPMLERGADLRAHILPEDVLFHDVGTAGRYLDAQEELMSGTPFLPVPDGVDPMEAVFQEASFAVDATGREYGNPDAVQGLASAMLTPPFFFGPRNELEPGARIGPGASLGALNRVGAGAVVQDAALWAQVEVAPGERMEGVIAGRFGGERLVVDGRPA